MKYRIGNNEFEAGTAALSLHLRDSNDALNNPEALRARLEDDGYLFIRGFHDRDQVLGVRREILERLRERGQLAPSYPLMDGIANPNGPQSSASVRGQEDLKTDSLRALLYSQRSYNFFERLFGAPAQPYKFQWLRAAGPGAGSPIHADLPYMGRGSHNLCTLWTPLGYLTPEMGPLALCLGSNKWPAVRGEYAHSDVDRDRHTGVFTNDSDELVSQMGGQWATTSFEPGDAVILGMYLLHGSLANSSNKFRISCDTRFQRADEPMDDRWAGEEPRGHETLWAPGAQIEPVEVSRRRWLALN
ncbi:1-deoxypentalenic acid 11-beta-hydroxylase [Abditibacteriota bacterium]|nr:1-deoxypentalenic acid 11-beta-hydroxylase [Abditibacteriota bacterium]